MTRYTADDYEIHVLLDAGSQECTAYVRDFPSLSFIAPTVGQAGEGMRALLGDVLDDMYSSGERVPDPGRWWE